jgi:hypothetical protein
MTENYLFKIYYQRGEVFEIIAPDEKTAFNIMLENHPEYRTFDLDKVEQFPINM